MQITPTHKQLELLEAAFSEKYTFILFGGAVGGAKTVGLYLLFLLAQRIFPGIQVIFLRKDLATIERNSYATWNEITNKFGIPESLAFDRRSNNTNPCLEMKNGSKLIFFGENFDKDKELTRWSGLIPNWFLADEINEIQYKSYLKMYERAGRYAIKGYKKPKPLIVATCNPSQGWVKQEIYDKWENGTLPTHILYIPSKITDNPNLPIEYINNLKNLPKYEYMVYVEGNWNVQLKTGGEFLKNFELDTHVSPVNLNSNSTIHISIDNNVFPYISISCWQLIHVNYRWLAVQNHEIVGKDPDNTATKSGKLTVEWLKEIGYNQRVFIYGDPTTKARNTIDVEKRTFLDLFIEPIKKSGYDIELCFFTKAPPVAATGDFINAIFEGKISGLSIIINETCKKSINDYIETKQDRDGTILKKRETNKDTGVSFEPNGHFTDTLRYFICKVFNKEFSVFQNRFSSYSDKSIPEHSTNLLDGF